MGASKPLTYASVSAPLERFTSTGVACGGSITTYLLESVRVTRQMKAERNFHAFYLLLSAPDTALLRALQLRGAGEHVYTRTTPQAADEHARAREHFGEFDAGTKRITFDIPTVDIAAIKTLLGKYFPGRQIVW